MLAYSKIDNNNYKGSNYLSSYDLLNKYNLKNLQNKTKLMSINIEISSQDILLSNE